MEIDITNEATLPEMAREVLTALPQNDAATVVALSGDLGAGKTTFVQTLAAELGVTEVVTSPTFVVMKSYDTTHEQFHTLVHIDAYRIEDIDEMRVLGFAELLAEKGTMICIEWAERIAPLLPAHSVMLAFTHTADSRTLAITHGN